MMISLRRGSSSSLEQIKGNQGIMDEPEADRHVGLDSISPSFSEVCSIESDQESDILSDTEEATSPASSSSPPSSSSSSSAAAATFSGQPQPDPLQDMSALMQQLPIKRGLSKYFRGKSQSFTSLSNVRSLEDLAKPENPYNKKMKSCKSYGGGLSESHHRSTNHHLPRTSSSSRFISKKTSSSRGSCSSLSAKRNVSFLGNRPPNIPSPHRSTSTTSISNQTPLFA